MQFNLDIAIVGIFLAINLIVGLYFGRGTKNLNEYAIGNRNFSTATITATIVATWISGSSFAVTISDTYKEGLWIAVAGLGNICALFIIGQVLGPRMKEFFGNLSVAEVMGNLYGTPIRVITALAAIAQATGMTALQIKVFSSIFSHFFALSSTTATIISSSIVIVYSAFGGIKSVTFTDVIQFFTFGVFIPVFALFIWQVIGSTELITNVIQTNPLLDYTQLLDYTNPKFFSYLFLFICFAIPGINSTLFQRTLMAKNTKQIRQSFTLAALICLFVHIFSCFIGLVILAYDNTLDPNNIAMYVIDKYSFQGLKGFAVMGIMAMVMSTADSWINTSAVLFTNDLCKPIGLEIKNELLISRIFAIFVGTGAIFLALSSTSLLQLVKLTSNFYKPIVTVPLFLAILGFRSTPKAVGIGMTAALLTVIIWKNNQQLINTGVDSAVPALLANLVCFLLAHYVYRQPGGWTRINDDSNLNEIKRQKEKKKEAIVSFFKNKSTSAIIHYFQKQLPRDEIIYSYFAFGTLLTIIVTFSLDKITYNQHAVLINCLQTVALLISTIFICRNILIPENFKEKYMGLIWLGSIFISLAFINSFLVLISKFSQISLVIFTLSLSIIGMLLNWQTTLVLILSGVTIAFYCYKYCFGVPYSTELYDLKLKIIYTIFILIGFLLAFLKPKQEQQELVEKRNEHLDNQLYDLEEEVLEMLSIKQEFLRNIEHETKTPITGTVSLAQSLLECYDKLPKEELIKTVKEIGRNGHRLESWANNLCDLANLNSLKANIEFKKVNLSRLAHTRIEFCRRLYQTNKHDLEFIYEIEPDIIINCSEYYIKQTVDNLIINALQYNKKGNITIYLRKEDAEVKLSIKDEGKGIPEEELYEIFNPFTVSSRTKTPAGGRGIGLALCKKVIDVHSGRIWAENNKDSGVTFNVIIPAALKVPKLEKNETTLPTTKVTRKFLQAIEDRAKKAMALNLLRKGVDIEVLKTEIELDEEENTKSTYSKKVLRSLQ